MSFLSQLNWRYATKSFDTTRKVSESDLDTILEAARLAPASAGLQAYHVYVVTNQEIKDKIQAVSWNQAQIGSSSHLLVFVARTDLLHVKEEHFTALSGGNADIRAQLAGYEGMVNGLMGGLEASNSGLTWSAKQSYISLGFALAAAAELQVDSCAMEGFDPVAVGEILGLPPTQKAVVMLPIGYRAATETPRPKFRFSRETLFTEVR
jgi:nitroreductase